MASSVFECEICNEEYDSIVHKPLFLNCGHTFCSKCLLSVTNEGSGGCPRCRQQILQSVDQLSINFSLIPGVKNDVPEVHYSSPDRCKKHGCGLDYLCLDCGNLICWKCSRIVHLNHRVESMEDFTCTGSSPEATRAFRRKLQLKLNRLQDLIAAPQEMLLLIEELSKYKTEFEQRLDSIFTQLTSVTQDLQAWDSHVSSSSDDNNENLREIIRRFGTPDSTPIQKMPTVSTTVARLHKTALELEATDEELNASITAIAAQKTGVLLPDQGCWSVVNETSSLISLASAHAGRRAAKITVISTPSAPVARLPLRLGLLSDACAGGLVVRDMEAFWRTPTEPARHLQNFCSKHGHKVTEYYGSAVDALALSRARGRSSLALGVRLELAADFDQCASLSHKPIAVSCIREFPATAGKRMKELGWRPLSWHFPDLQDDDLDWLYTLVDPFFVPKLFRCYLPRCNLSERGLRKLIKRYSKKFSIYCENFSIPQEHQFRLENLAQKNYVDLNWTLPVDDITT